MTISNNNMKKTKILDSKIILKTIPFDVEECNVEFDGKATKHPFYRLAIRDWVNIIAITDDDKIILIKQDRIGSESLVIEAPGGVYEDHKHTSLKQAAIMELEEETGYTSTKISELGHVNPNPAINNNRVHFFLAEDARINPKRTHFPDEYEYTEVLLVSFKELREMLSEGTIDHALSNLLIYKALDKLGKL